MPKQVTFDSFVEMTGVSAEDYMRPYFRVGWDKTDKTVSVATVNPRGKIYRYDKDSGNWVVPDGGVPGWFVYLNRSDINKLIKDLRKARDDAFGRDE